VILFSIVSSLLELREGGKSLGVPRTINDARYLRSQLKGQGLLMVTDSILERAHPRNSVRFPRPSPDTPHSSLPAPFPPFFSFSIFCLAFLSSTLSIYRSKSNSSDSSGFSIKCLRTCHLSVHCTFLFPEFLVMVTTYTYDCVCRDVVSSCVTVYACTARICMRVCVYASYVSLI